MSVTRFFGGAGLSKDGVQFCFVIEGVLYLRVDDAEPTRIRSTGRCTFYLCNADEDSQGHKLLRAA